MTRARDNADLGDSYGALAVGVTGGSGLNAVSPANLASGVLPVGVTGGSGLTLVRMQKNQNLVVKYVSATTVDIDADFLTVLDTNFAGVVLSSVNLTVDITASGANGLDTGSEAAIWYHIYVIYNGTMSVQLIIRQVVLGIFINLGTMLSRRNLLLLLLKQVQIIRI